MSDSIYGSCGMINTTKERKELPKNEIWVCASSNFKVNCVILDLESATKTTKNLKEELESENMEVRNTKVLNVIRITKVTKEIRFRLIKNIIEK